MIGKVRDFYAEKGLHVEKILAKRPEGISEEQCLQSAMDLYHAIRVGFRIKDISMARRIWKDARGKSPNGIMAILDDRQGRGLRYRVYVYLLLLAQAAYVWSTYHG